MITDLGTFGFVLYVLSVSAVVILAILANVQVGKRFENFPLKKIAWAVLVAAGAYWYITIPAARAYRDDATTKLALKADLESSSPETRYIHDHHYRIEDLEREMQDARKEIRELTIHYERLLQLLLLGAICYGVSFFANSRRPDSDDRIRLDLDKE